MEKKITRVLDCKAEHERLLLKVEELTALCERTTTSLTGMPRGSAALTDETWAKLMDYKRTCSDKLNEYYQMKIELEAEFGMIKNADVRTVLSYKYVDGLTIDDIADCMHYSTRTIDRYLRIGREAYKRL